MRVLLRCAVLCAFIWLQLSGISFAKQVYLQDGGIIDCESFWKRNGQIFVKVNRDILLEFAPSEINIAKTFPQVRKKPHAIRRKPATGPQPAYHAAAPVVQAAAPPAPADSPQLKKDNAPPVVPAPAASMEKQKIPTRPVAAPASAAAPPAAPAVLTAKETAPVAKEAALPDPAPATSTDPATAPGKAELERQSRQNAELMAEAIRKKDPELMKKAVEAQRGLLQQQKGTPPPAAAGHRLLFILLFLSLLLIVSTWVVFEKAGHSGIKSLIPFYNIYLLMEISGKPGWWFILVLIPVIGLPFYLLAMLSLAEKFGRSALFGLGLFLLPIFCFPLLAFGGSQYEATGEEMNFTFSEEPPPAQP